MKISINKLAKILDGEIIGNEKVTLYNLSKIEDAIEGDITFLSNPKYIHWLYKTKASVVIIDRGIDYKAKDTPNLLVVENAYYSFNKLLNLISKKKLEFTGIHKLSSVDKSTVVGKDVSIGKFTTIDPKCKIGNNVFIMDNVSIKSNVTIGDNCVIHSGVRIYEDSIIENECIIHSNSVIGSDGFGYAPDDNGIYIKTPQIGNVHIKSNVEIGSNCSIDRATLGSTFIDEGVKIDNLVQVAHNVKIGKNTVIAGQAGIAGSTVIGKNCQIGGQVGFVGHLKVGDNVRINGQAGVFSNIPDDSIIKGTPAIDERNFNRSYVLFKNFEKVIKDLNFKKGK